MHWCPFKIRQNCLAHPKSYFGPWSSNHHIQHCKYGSDITAGGGGRGRGSRRGEGAAFHFSKPLQFVLGVPNGNFLPEKKKTLTLGKKSGKTTLPPLKNIPVTSLKYGQDLLTFTALFHCTLAEWARSKNFSSTNHFTFLSLCDTLVLFACWMYNSDKNLLMLSRSGFPGTFGVVGPSGLEQWSLWSTGTSVFSMLSNEFWDGGSLPDLKSWKWNKLQN